MFSPPPLEVKKRKRNMKKMADGINSLYFVHGFKGCNAPSTYNVVYRS